MTMEIDKLTSKNFAQFSRQIAETHLLAYSKAHFTANFSAKQIGNYYSYLIEASEIALIAFENKQQHGDSVPKVMGIVVGGPTISNGVSRYVQDNKIYLISVMLRKPRFIFQKLKTFLKSKLHHSAKSDEAKFRLLSIVVSPEIQSMGLGRKLLESFEANLRQRGWECYGLSVRSDNCKAIRFYEKNGFILEEIKSGSMYYKKYLATHD